MTFEGMLTGQIRRVFRIGVHRLSSAAPFDKPAVSPRQTPPVWFFPQGIVIIKSDYRGNKLLCLKGPELFQQESKDYNSICVPSSTTLLGGIPK